MTHPGFLALDRHALAPDAVVAEHVAACETCRAHVALVQRDLPIPQWVRPREAPRSRWLWVPVALTAGLVTVVSAPALLAPATQSKGAPSVAVWLKRGAGVSRWAGERLRAGDAVRLELSGTGYGFATVAGGDGRVLYRGAPGLTPAWELDAAPGDETLLVVYSKAAVGDDGLAALAKRHDAEVWAVKLVLQKEPGR